jgi:hypothetical protein
MAFFAAFSSNVPLSSSTTGHPGKSSIVRIAIGISPMTLFISSTFFLFLVARTISIFSSANSFGFLSSSSPLGYNTKTLQTQETMLTRNWVTLKI